MTRTRKLEGHGSRTGTLVVHVVCSFLLGPIFQNRTHKPYLDIPAHCYQLSFESNPAWSTFYAKAPEILEYWKRVADKYGVRKYMKLSHKAMQARWDESTSKWVVTLQNITTGEVFEDTADALFTGIGVLNE